MRVLMLSWEYPPMNVGGLARHVYYLSRGLANRDVEVHVVTLNGEAAAGDEANPVQVHRVSPWGPNPPDFLMWVLQLNVSVLQRAVELSMDFGFPSLVHAHDWLVYYAGSALKRLYRVPLLATIHATERGRHNGIHNQHQQYINDSEWWLTYEAWRVITCSEYMKHQVASIFSLPYDKLRSIPNGIDPAEMQPPAQLVPRDRFALPEEKIVMFVGRLVREKGVEVLLEAVPQILRAEPLAKFVVAGTGPMEGPLRNRARELGVEGKVLFAGYINDVTRNSLYHYADVAVVPSLYEPFGIVALEAMAARTAAVVSDTGGLGECVHHGHDGLRTAPGDATSLASNVVRILKDQALRQQLEDNAYRKVHERFHWQKMADSTLQLYREVLEEHQGGVWKREGWQDMLRTTALLSKSVAERAHRQWGRYYAAEKEAPH